MTESIEEHSLLSVKYMKKIINVKHLDKVLENFRKSLLKGCSLSCITLWKEIVLNTIYLHDIGKANPYYQNYRLNNSNFSNYRRGDTGHSIFSSAIFYNIYINKINKLPLHEQDLLINLITISCYVIQRHHSKLNKFNTSMDNLEDIMSQRYSSDIFVNINNSLSFAEDNITSMALALRKAQNLINDHKNIDLYIYSRFLYSLLVAADYYATFHFKTGKPIDDFGVIDDISKYISLYNNTPILKKIKEHNMSRNVLKNKELSKSQLLNNLRSDIFLESSAVLSSNVDKDIFFLPAPTGAGKTNISINLALKLLNNDKHLNKIYYTFPFNNLVEQTKKSLLETFNYNEDICKDIVVVNSPKFCKKKPCPLCGGEEFCVN